MSPPSSSLFLIRVSLLTPSPPLPSIKLHCIADFNNLQMYFNYCLRCVLVIVLYVKLLTIWILLVVILHEYWYWQMFVIWLVYIYVIGYLFSNYINYYIHIIDIHESQTFNLILNIDGSQFSRVKDKTHKSVVHIHFSVNPFHLPSPTQAKGGFA